MATRTYATATMMNDLQLKNTLTSRIENIDISLQRLAQDLKSRGVWETVEGMQISSSRRLLELVTHHDSTKQTLLTGGLDTHGVHLNFDSETPMFVNVSLFNIPLEAPEHMVSEHMGRYGEIHGSFKVKKKFLGKVIYIGTRVYQFKLLNRDIPRNISMFGRGVRVMYSGQPEQTNKPAAERRQAPAKPTEPLMDNEPKNTNNERDNTNEHETEEDQTHVEENTESDGEMETEQTADELADDPTNTLPELEKTEEKLIERKENETPTESRPETAEDETNTLETATDEPSQSIIPATPATKIPKPQDTRKKTTTTLPSNINKRARKTNSLSDNEIASDRKKKTQKKLTLPELVALYNENNYSDIDLTKDVIVRTEDSNYFKASLVYFTYGPYDVDNMDVIDRIPYAVINVWKKIKRDRTTIQQELMTTLDKINLGKK